MQEHEDSLKTMLAAINFVSGITYARSGIVLNQLAEAYRAGDHQPGSLGYDELRQKLAYTYENEVTREIFNVVAHGDPAYWPGLTAPAVDALGSLLSSVSKDPDRISFRRYRYTGRTIDALNNFKKKDELSLQQCERLTPVFGGLAAVLKSLPQNDGVIVHRKIAELFSSAPAQALEEPLQSLVRAYVQRIEDGVLTPDEDAVLQQIKAKQVSRGQITEGFRPISDRL